MEVIDLYPRLNQEKLILRVTLPLPPDSNHIYRRSGLNIHLSREARDFEDLVILSCKNQCPGYSIPSHKPLQIFILLTYPTNRINRLDWDGQVKALQDAIFKGSATKANDAWVRRAVVQKIAEPGSIRGYSLVELREFNG